jgi:hypothetical protein
MVALVTVPVKNVSIPLHISVAFRRSSYVWRKGVGYVQFDGVPEYCGLQFTAYLNQQTEVPGLIALVQYVFCLNLRT